MSVLGQFFTDSDSSNTDSFQAHRVRPPGNDSESACGYAIAGSAFEGLKGFLSRSLTAVLGYFFVSIDYRWLVGNCCCYFLFDLNQRIFAIFTEKLSLNAFSCFSCYLKLLMSAERHFYDPHDFTARSSSAHCAQSLSLGAKNRADSGKLPFSDTRSDSQMMVKQ